MIPSRSSFTASIIICVLRLCVPCCTCVLLRCGGFDQQPALADVVRDRLLDVDVLAGVAGQDRRRASASGRAW